MCPAKQGENSPVSISGKFISAPMQYILVIMHINIIFWLENPLKTGV